MAVARIIIVDCTISAKDISIKLSATVQAVNDAIRKIRTRLEDGLAVPGLSDDEIGNLYKAIGKRAGLMEEVKVTKQEEKILYDKVIGIMREHAVSRLFDRGCRVVDIAAVAGISKKEVRRIIDGAGCRVDEIIREMYRESISVTQIADTIGLPRKEVRNTLEVLGYNLKVRVKRVKFCNLSDVGISKVSTVKPCKPRSSKAVFRRAAKISRRGLADWNKVHYDSSGKLRMTYGCAPPADLPRKFPSQKALVLPAKEPVPSFFPAQPPPKAECSKRGRARIGYMRFF